jgi:hypothetical protein
MILIIVAIFLGIAGLLWLWKGVISKSAGSLQDSGSGKKESYVIIFLVTAVLVTALYLVLAVL